MKKILVLALVFSNIAVFAQRETYLYSKRPYDHRYSISHINEQEGRIEVVQVSSVSFKRLEYVKSTAKVKSLKFNNLESINYTDITVIPKYEISELSPIIKYPSTWFYPKDKSDEDINIKSTNYIQSKESFYYNRNKPAIDTLVNDVIETYEFDPFYQQYFYTGKNKRITYDHPTRSGMSLMTLNVFRDAYTNNTLYVLPAKRDKTDKFKFYKEFELSIKDKENETIQHFDASFNYTSVYDSYYPVFSTKEEKTIAGYIFVFKRIASKQADPERQNMNIVYMSLDGKHQVINTNFRPTKKGWERIRGAVHDGDNLIISYNSYGADGAFSGLKKVAKDGSISDIKFEDEHLNKSVIHINPARDRTAFNKKNILSSIYQKPNYRINIEQDVLGATEIDSKLYIWTQAKYGVKDDNHQLSETQMAVGNSGIKYDDYYSEAFIYEYDKNTLEFKNIYMVDLPPIKEETSTFHILNNPDGGLELGISFRMPKNIEYEKTTIYKNLNGQKRLPNGYESLHKAIFVKINDKFNSYYYFDDLYLADRFKGFHKSIDGRNYLIGLKITEGVMKLENDKENYEYLHSIEIKPIID